MSLRSSFQAILALCLAVPVLAGCNTIAGVGRDISAVGGMVTNVADGSQQGIANALNESAIAPAAGVAQSSNTVYFDLGSAYLTADARDTIRAAAVAAGAGDGPAVRVAGHADTVGSASANDRLSQRRAQAVAEELAAQGVPRNRIVVDWHGERALPVPTADNTPDAQNRVVTIDL
jgi:outer membrane protein OmpA-like peptidoglycan-associated protein